MALLRELQLIVKGWKAKRIKPDKETDVNPKESDVVVVQESPAGESKVVSETPPE
jgi:hypothetical protein